MADDLDDFLKQAAQRRKQRQQNKAERPPIEPVPPPGLSPATSVPTLSRSDDAYSRPNAPQSANRLEPMVDLSQPIETAQVVEENRLPSQVREQSSKPKKPKKGSQKPSPSSQSTFAQSSLAASSLAPSESTTANAAVVSTANNSQMISSGNIAEQLRNPQTLRTAIIVHEILKRPWQ
jgi:hypothetical protein